MDSIKVIVARYNENVDWLKDINLDYIVYNKGQDDLPNWIKNVIKVPNIGREEETYLQYIVNNYNNLPDRVIFTQADPFLHSPDFLGLLKCTDKFEDVQPLSWGYSSSNPKIKQTLLLSGNRIFVTFFDNYLNKVNFPNVWIHGADKKFFLDFLKITKEEEIRNSMFDLLQLEKRSFNNMDITPMCYCAIFSVIKERIKRKPKEYYEYLLNYSRINSKKVVIEWEEKVVFGWIMEFMWLEIFEYEPSFNINACFLKNSITLF